MSKAKKQTYVKKDPISHILDRPDMYVGSTRSRQIQEYVVVDEEYHIEKRMIDISPAILRIFIEPLSNAIDNVARSKLGKNKVTKISIEIDEKTGLTSIWNDGEVIPVEINEQEKCYNHSLIFGQLLTSSNYDDTQDREDISGKNGVGGKATNVFSKEFCVEGNDPENKKHLIQKWADNMKTTSEPVITKSKSAKGFTKVSYIPDFSRFGIEGYTEDILSLYRRYIVDTAMLTKVSVSYNNVEIPVNSLSEYAKLYSKSDTETLTIKTKDCEVVIASCHNDPLVISFANGIYTPLGGTHVDAWSEALFRPLLEKLNKPKKPQLNISDIKKYFRLFVVATVKKPEFDSQSKTKLEGPLIQAEVKKSHIATISKWSVMEMLEDMIRAKEMVVLKKSERKKRGHERVEGLDPANNEGGSKGHECTLILVEGLSAKTYAAWGIQKGAFGKAGRDWYGILALRGKCVAPETPVLLWDGLVKRADEVKLGDRLIGSNGYPSTVKSITSGEDVMYKINQKYGDSYIVNSKHTLTFRVTAHKKIMWFEKRNAWVTSYFDNNNYKMRFVQEETYDKCKEIIFKVPDNNIFDIEIQKYISLDEDTKSYLHAFKCDCINWDEQEIDIDSYILGLWLGDNSNEDFSSEDPNFFQKLEKYNLINNKHIPSCYIQNSRENRLKLLAGLIDRQGYFDKISKRIEIVQTIENKRLIGQIVYLCRSLGYFAEVSKEDIAKRIYISGTHIDEIPTILSYKKCIASLRENTISVEKIGKGNYVGFEVDNDNRFLLGDFTVTHNCLNCRNAKPLSISNNAIVTDIIKSLGIQYGLDYSIDENYKKLRYGRLMIITDSDVDGIHISGLIQNMFHALFPSLLKRDPPFLTSMQTPIVRVYEGKTSKLFYDEREFRKYVEQNGNKKINKKYYKGLGSSNEQDVLETFGQKLVEFKEDDHTFENMNKAFNSKYADMRKEWLESYDPNNIVLKWDGNKEEKQSITYSDFINTELIKFSIDDCKRSIPSLMDGLKEGHRKVLYVTLLRNLRHNGPTIKVAQLAGSVSEKSGYHHGEKNLELTITNMANAYVGSNNIPLLFRDGQFGSRQAGGHDAAAGRYIWTKLDALTRLIFREEDDVLLEHNEDDGEVIEPRFYVPIIPMLLVNGITAGIGTGWSCSVPAYNPLDLVNLIRVWLDNGNKSFDTSDDISVSLLPEIKPWYRGHKGELTSEGEGKYTSWGKIERDKKGKVMVSELPVGYWTNDFTDDLEKLKEEKQITNYKNYSTPKEINFVITESDDGINCDLTSLKLCRHIRITNMVLFTENGKLKKFSSVEDIIDNFCEVRYSYYVKRKAKQLKDLQREIMILGNKERFLREIRDGDFKLFEEKNGKKESRKSSDVVEELEEKEYDKDSEDTDNGYGYLLRLQISSITAEKINKLRDDLANRKSSYENLLNTQEKDIWLRDLAEFEDAYNKWLPVINNESVKKKK